MELCDVIAQIHGLNITPCEYEILRILVLTDLTEKEIAEETFKAKITVYQHVQSLKRKLKTHTSRGLVAKSIKLGLVNLDNYRMES